MEETNNTDCKTKKFCLADGVSIDELKVSVIVLGFIVSLFYGLIMYYTRGDISDNFVSILQTMLLVIGGVNVANTVTDFFNKRRFCK